MSEANPNTESTSESRWIVQRPTEIVQHLSLEDKWEVTRRHPYYLMFWKSAQPLPSNASQEEQMRQFAACLFLQQINVSSAFPPPSTSPQDLGADQVESPWKEGAIARVKVRNVVATMIGVLPIETKRAVIDLLQQSLQLSEERPHQRYELIRDVAQGDYPFFDGYFPDLLVSINPNASQRAAAQAIERIVRDYKQQHDIPERRRRNEKLDEYLRVWDLREGWTGENYNCATEQKLNEIARQHKTSVQTVANRYCAAFKLIVGHEYSAELWAKVIGTAKMAGLLGSGSPRLSSYRPMRKRRPREVLETTLQKSNANSKQQSFLQNVGFSDDQFEQIELCMDVSDLIFLGKTNAEIIEALDMEDIRPSHDFIDYFRQGGKGPLD